MHLSCEEDFSGALVHMAQAIVPGPEVKAKGHDFRRVLYIWWRRRGSNSRPYGCEPYALPSGAVICVPFQGKEKYKTVNKNRLFGENSIWPRSIFKMQRSKME